MVVCGLADPEFASDAAKLVDPRGWLFDSRSRRP